MKKADFAKSIEIWRILFALSVVFCHAVLLPAKPSNYLCTTLGVEFFFLVSGYLMAASAWNKPETPTPGADTWAYITKKLSVIFPVYLLAFIFEFLHAFLLRNNADPSGIPYYLFDLLFLRAAGWRQFGAPAFLGASWYLSAYFISILLLYPFLRKNKDFFLHIAAPAIVILGGGWFIIRESTINYSLEMDYELGICFGLLRGVIEMCLGCTCFTVTKTLAERGEGVVTPWRRIIWTVVEIGTMGSVFWLMLTTPRGNSDFLALVLLSFGIIAAFSGYSYTAAWLKNANVSWVSGFALTLYLNHYAWYRTFQNRLPEMPFVPALLCVLVLSILTSLLSMFLIGRLKAWKEKKQPA